MTSTKNKRSKAWQQKLEADFLATYEAQSNPLFRHCLLRVRDREAAKDIVQESFSRMWLYLSEGKTISYPRAFLYRVATNLIVDGSRKKRSTSLDVLMDEDGFEPADESIREPTDRTAAREALAFLKSLDEIYRTAVEMRFIDGLSPKEIARDLGVSENVVSVRIHRGLERLNKMMDRAPLERSAS